MSLAIKELIDLIVNKNQLLPFTVDNITTDSFLVKTDGYYFLYHNKYFRQTINDDGEIKLVTTKGYGYLPILLNNTRTQVYSPLTLYTWKSEILCLNNFCADWLLSLFEDAHGTAQKT